MTMRKLRALVVDDQSYAFKALKSAMHEAAIDLDVLQVMPSSDDEDWPKRLSQLGKELDDIDIAFIDIELTERIMSNQHFGAAHLTGGSAVLPWLREFAPWVPAIGWSKLLRPDQLAPHHAAYASSFGFDAFIPKDLTTRNDRQEFPSCWSPALWNWMHQTAVGHRLKAQVPDLRFERVKLDAEIPVDAGRELLDELDIEYPKGRLAHQPAWRTLLAWLFGGFADKIRVTALTRGFSGARVIEVTCVPREYPDTMSRWVVKLSRRPSKLNEEAAAHSRLARTSALVSHAVPLLGHGVVALDGVGVLAYAFADGKPAASLLAEGTSVGLIRSLRGIHAPRQIETVEEVGALILADDEWKKFQIDAVSALGGVPAGLAVLFVKGATTLLGHPLAYARVMAHGDLHLDNILLGADRDFVIDWPARRRAPLALDVSKLVTDAVRRSLGGTLTHLWLTGLDWPWMQPVLASFELSEDDLLLVRAFSIVEYTRMLSYRDVSPEHKAIITSYLKDNLANERWALDGR